jgi:hypothetical protein
MIQVDLKPFLLKHKECDKLIKLYSLNNEKVKDESFTCLDEIISIHLGQSEILKRIKFILNI